MSVILAILCNVPETLTVVTSNNYITTLLLATTIVRDLTIENVNNLEG